MPPLVIALAVTAAVAFDIYLIWRLGGRKVPTVLVGPFEKTRTSKSLSAIEVPPIRWERTVEFIVGCVFMIAAHALFWIVPPIFQLFRLGEWLNSLLLLDVANPVNTIIGGGLLVIGIVLVARAARPTRYAGQASLAVTLRRARRRHVYLLILAALLLLFVLLWQLSSHEPPGYLPLLWVATLILTAVVALIFDRQQERPLRPSADRWDLLVLLALVVGGLVIGTFRLSTIPFSMIGDEGRFFEVASSIATVELRPSFFGFGVYSFPMVASLYQGLVLRVFGLSLWSWRFASVLIAVTATVPTYLIVRESFDRRLAFFSGALMLVTPYFIAIERLGYNNSQALLPVTLAIYLVYVGLRRSSVLYLTLGGIAAGLGFYTYTAGRLGVVVCLVFILLTLIAHRGNRPRPGLVLLGAFLLAFAVTAGPHLYHGFVANPVSLGYKTFESLFPNLDYALDIYELPALERDHELLELGANSFFFRLDLYAQLIIRGALRTGLALSHPIIVTSHYIAAPLAGPLGGFLLAVGLALALAGYRQTNFQLIIIWMLAGLLLLSALNTFPPRHLHLVPIIPAMSILMALGLATVSDFLGTLLPKQRMIYATGFGAAGLLLLSVTGLRNYFETAQYRHPPNVEDLIAFTALQLEAPRELIYVSSSAELLEFEPWILSRIPNRASYENIDARALEDRELSDQSAVTIFFEEKNAEEVRKWVEKSLGDRAVLESHRSRGRVKRVLTYSFAPGSAPPIENEPGQEPGAPTAWLAVLAASTWTFALMFTFWRRFLQPRRLKRMAGLGSDAPLEPPAAEVRRSGSLWMTKQRAKLSTFTRSLQRQMLPPISGTLSDSIERSNTRTILGEVALVGFVVLIFSTQYLDPDPQQLLPGQEYGVLSYPDQVLYRSLENHGTFPLWNPYIRSGHPYLGDPFAHPFNLVSSVPVLLLGVANGYKVAVLVSLMLAGLGMWILGRVLGLNRPTRLWSATLYALNGQAIARFIQGQYLFIFGYAWIPFVLAALLLSLKTRKRSNYALTALALAMLYFTGTSYYPLYMVLIFLGLGVALLVEGGRVQSGREVWARMHPIVFIGILALGLVAIQLLPALKLRPHILKPSDPDLKLSIPLREAVISFFSNSTERTDLLVQLPPQEFYAYIGLFPVLAAVLVIPAARYGERRKEILGFALLLAFALLWGSIAYTPLAAAYRKAPLLHQFRYTSRTLILGVLALVSLGGLGLTWFMGRLRGAFDEPAEGPGKRLAYAGLLLLMIFSVAAVFRENLRFVRTRSRDVAIDTSVAALADQTSSAGDASIPLSTGWHVAVGTYGLRYWDAWYGFDFFPPAAPTVWRFREAPNYLLQPVDLEVYYDDAEALYEIGENVIYEIEGSLPYAFTVPESVLQPLVGLEITGDDVVPMKSTDISPNEIRMEGLPTAAPGWVVVRSSFYPGWTATVDGDPKEVEAVGGFIGTRVVPGATYYVFRYQPPIFELGVGISAYTLMIVILIFAEPWIALDRIRSQFQAMIVNATQNVRWRG
ncbi:MAG: glycosyltransferase family 39 protein [Anaerolineales bacterium]